MNPFTKANLFYNFIKWRLTWDKRDTHYRYTVPGNPKFMGPRDAVKLIKNGSVVGVSGLAANHRPSIIYWAIRELYEETGNPRDLTLVTLGGIGGRGKVPGTLEELGQEGLCTRLITGHTETFKAMLRLADAGKLELQCIPQGIIALLFAAMGEGENSIVTETGIGTFVDPQTGRGSPVSGAGAPQLVTVENGKLRYTIPKVDVAIFNMPAADRKGNIYRRGCIMVAESRELVRAARRNNGVVIANVGKIVEEGYDDIYYKWTEQTGGVYHHRPWRFLTLESDMSIQEGIERVRFINRLVGVTPKRSPVDFALARLAASTFVENFPKGGIVDIGVGLPEEVSRLLHESGAMEHITLITESGVLGGLAAPGIFFGAAVNPNEIVSSAEVFRRMYKHLDGALLGILQADSAGNINVSKRGDGPLNYVGPGGFIDITTCAENCFFVGSWGDRAEIVLENGKMRVVNPGKPKFVDQVDEITFNGQEALRRGKKVFYVTHVGAFQLTPRGMELIRVMPGIDVRRDIVNAVPMKVVLPETGDVPVVDRSIITGENFKLTFPS